MSDIRWRDIRDTLRLEEVESELGLQVEVRGDEHYCSCPLPSHPGTDANPSFSINSEKLIYGCFVCGGGTIPDLVSSIQGMTYREAVEWLVEFSDADSEDYTERFIRQLDRSMQPEEKISLSRGGLLSYYPSKDIEVWSKNIGEAEEFLKSKWGITLETAEEFKLGVAFDFNRQGYTGPALIVPHYFNHELQGYQARWFSDERPKSIPKYVNNPGFPKGTTLFGWDKIDKSKQVVVVESVMTAMRLWQECENAVATFGASYPEDQLRLLRSLDKGIILAYDNDEAGRDGMYKLVDTLEGHISIEVARPPTQEKGDLADLSSEEIKHNLQERIPSFWL